MQKGGNEIKDSTKNDIAITDSEEKNFESDDNEKNNSEIKSICRYCLQPIKTGAKICHNCGKHQSKFSGLPYFFATLAIPLAVVIFAGLQVYVNKLQFDEAKAKRVEAGDVLKSAKKVLADATNDSEEIRERAASILSDARNSVLIAKQLSSEAKDEANEVLSIARKESKAVIDKANEARRGFDKASEEVEINLQKSNERITLAENNFLQNFNKLTREIEEIKKDLSAELAILKERNQLVSLADKSINNSNREAFDELMKIASDDNELPNRKSMAMAEVLRVKSHYVSGTRLTGVEIELKQPDQVILRDSDIPTEDLINILQGHWDMLKRAKAAKLLSKRKEKEVPEALILAMKSDKCLDVLKESIESFVKVTECKQKDVV